VKTGLPRRLAPVLVVVVLAVGLRGYLAIAGVGAPPPDAERYAQISRFLYEQGRFPRVGELPPHPRPTTHLRPSDYAPGPSLFFAGVYYATGGVHPWAARLLAALLGGATAFVAYALGRRLAGEGAGLFAAGVVALHPVLVAYGGLEMTEPFAAFTLSAAVLSFVWAADRHDPRAWLLTGALLGVTAIFRPEYLLVGLALAAMAGAAVVRAAGPRRGIAAACVVACGIAVAIGPWTLRNLIVLDRFVPITTGGGKSLFIGTYLPGDGAGAGTKRELARRYGRGGGSAPPDFAALLDRVAARYPGRSRDAALTNAGLHNLRRYATDDPLDYAGMFARKAWTIWRTGACPGGPGFMRAPPWVALHLLLVVLALVGLLDLARRRRVEAGPLGLVIGLATLIGVLLIASPRRALVPLPLLAALAGVAVATIATRLRATGY
jgi:4-amino-4-deoxy-L-arabinose transferase-like glycosyltransferase